MEEEEFKTCPNIADFQVSNLGNIKDDQDHMMQSFINKAGYTSIVINNKYFYIHRLVAIAFIPNPENKKCVDHINHNRSDNKLSNLRWATHGENGKNKKLSVKNKSGYPGIQFNTYYNKWSATIGYNNKLLFLGWFELKDLAIKARQNKELELFGSFRSIL